MGVQVNYDKKTGEIKSIFDCPNKATHDKWASGYKDKNGRLYVTGKEREEVVDYYVDLDTETLMPKEEMAVDWLSDGRIEVKKKNKEKGEEEVEIVVQEVNTELHVEPMTEPTWLDNRHKEKVKLVKGKRLLKKPSMVKGGKEYAILVRGVKVKGKTKQWRR